MILADQGDIKQPRLLPQSGKGAAYISLKVIPSEAELLPGHFVDSLIISHHLANNYF